MSDPVYLRLNDGDHSAREVSLYLPLKSGRFMRPIDSPPDEWLIASWERGVCHGLEPRHFSPLPSNRMGRGGKVSAPLNGKASRVWRVGNRHATERSEWRAGCRPGAVAVDRDGADFVGMGKVYGPAMQRFGVFCNN